jgi:hypothetical protein
MAVSLSLLVVPAAQGATEDYLDRDHGVRFMVDGPVLTVRLEPQTGQRPPDIRQDVWGRQVRVACSPVFTARERTLLRTIVISEQLWPEGQLEARFTFDRDISDWVKWCLLEGADAEGLAIVVLPGGRTSLGTQLRRNSRGGTIGRRLCGLVRDSGVPLGPTAVYGRTNVKLRSC